MRTMNGQSDEFLSSPGGLFMHNRPDQGQAVMIGDHAEIVRQTRRLSAEDAEDFDMFEFADFGGWEVVATRPDNEAEMALCAAEESRIAQAQHERSEALARLDREEDERRAREEAERQAYAAWQDANLTGLHSTTTFPTQLDPDPTGRTIWSYSVGEPVYWSQAVGWYTTGDKYQALDVDGERGWLCQYGNAMVAYVPLAVADRWYRDEWSRIKDDPRRMREHWRRWAKYGGEIYGGDFDAWSIANIGLEAIQERAGAVPVFIAGLEADAVASGDIIADSYGVRRTVLWGTPETLTTLRAAGYDIKPAPDFRVPEEA